MRPIRRQAALAIAAAIGLSAMPAVYAQDSAGGYIGASMGNVDPSQSGFDGETGFRIFGGYMFSPAYGIEAGYADLGNFKNKRTNARISADGTYVAGVGSFSATDRIKLFGKLGFMHYGLDERQNGAKTGSDDGTEFMLGLGADYYLTESLARGAEYNTVSNVGNNDVDAIWLNIRYDMGSY